MDINLKEFNYSLQEGETVEWTGKAEPFPLKDSANSGRLVLRWCLTAIITAALIILYCVYSFSKPEHNFSIALVLIVAAIGIYIMCVPLVDRNMILKKKYLITNKNIVIFTRETDKSIMHMEDVDKADIIYAGKDTAHVVFSKDSAKKTNDPGIRKLAMIPRQADAEGDSTIVSMAFYNVKGIDLLKRSLPSKVRITERK